MITCSTSSGDDAGALERGLDREAAEVGSGERGERTAHLADRRAGSGDDVRTRHDMTSMGSGCAGTAASCPQRIRVGLPGGNAEDCQAMAASDDPELVRRAQRIDIARSVPLGVLLPLETSVLLTIAIKQFDAAWWVKWLVAAGSGVGLLARRSSRRWRVDGVVR